MPSLKPISNGNANDWLLEKREKMEEKVVGEYLTNGLFEMMDN